MNTELKEKIVQFIKDNPEVKIVLIDAEENLHSNPQLALTAAITISAGNPKITELVVVDFLEELKKEAEEQAKRLADEQAAEALKKQQAKEAEDAAAEALKKQQAKEADKK